jgi:hypothetical protein
VTDFSDCSDAGIFRNLFFSIIDVFGIFSAAEDSEWRPSLEDEPDAVAVVDPSTSERQFSASESQSIKATSSKWSSSLSSSSSMVMTSMTSLAEKVSRRNWNKMKPQLKTKPNLT